MTLQRRKDGGYEGLWRLKGMKPLHLSLRTKSKKVAQSRHNAVAKLVRQKRWEMIDQLRSGDLTVERVEAMVEHQEPLLPVARGVRDEPTSEPWDTVDEATERYEAWYATHSNRRDATRQLVKFELQRFRNFVWEGGRIGDRRLDDVPQAAIEAYQTSMIAAAVPVNTVTVYMSRVPALFRWAAKEEERLAREARRAARALHVPVDRERLAKGTQRRDRVLTVDEADALMARTPDPMKFPVACGLLAGLRLGETLHLRPGLDVDTEMGTLHVKEQAGWRPKTTRAIRVVPMAEPLKQLAVRHVRDFASELWMHPSPIVHGEPISQKNFAVQFARIVSGAGMVYGRDQASGVTYHTLRHTFATHAVQRGVDLYTVATLLGDSVKMVEQVYADILPVHKRAAIATLAQAFNILLSSEADDGRA